MKIKTSELKGNALDWAVAKCESVKLEIEVDKHGKTWLYEPFMFGEEYRNIYQPSNDWAQGGVIIEREKIAINSPRGVGWVAEMWSDATHPVTGHFTFGGGDTPLEAAMRCYVASKLGSEVEIPNELTEEK